VGLNYDEDKKYIKTEDSIRKLEYEDPEKSAKIRQALGAVVDKFDTEIGNAYKQEVDQKMTVFKQQHEKSGLWSIIL